MTQLPTGLVSLSNLATIEVSGADAANFLHAQLSQDILALTPNKAALAVYCNPQGRALVSILCSLVEKHKYWLVVSRDLINIITQKLKLFVLRSQVSITDISASVSLYGEILARNNPVTDQPWQQQFTSEQQHWINLYPAHQQARRLWLVPNNSAANFPAPTVSSAAWHYSQILSGVVEINAQTSGLFVPQMLNYESIDGINFKKGCYPGQEVIARSQFRGAIKRRSYIVASQQVITPQADIYTYQDPVSVCGTVIQSASYQQQHLASICVQTKALQCYADNGYLFAMLNKAPIKLDLLPLPYQLKEDL